MEHLISDLTLVSVGMIVFWTLVLALLIHLIYYFFFFLRLARYRKPQLASESQPVSVVICAKNEEDNLMNFLPKILDQDYPDFEVVVVNDCSYDNTGDVLEEFAKKNVRLKVVTIKEDEYYSHGKKVALMMGIKGAKHDLLLLTDADCQPNSNAWLKNMTAHFQPETEIVLGYGPYEKQKGLLNKLIRFDAWFIAMQYLSYALARKTYMGVGRNLAYRKELFFRHKGFRSHYHIPSGDDDLFVNEAATKKNTVIEIDPQSFTYSVPEQTWHGWWRQKMRHLQTGKRYKFGHKFLLGCYVFAQWLLLGCLITLLVFKFQLYVVLGLIFLKILIQILTFRSGLKKLGETDLLPYALLLNLTLQFFYPIITVARIFRRKSKWN
ncbi:MAG: glycosyltransferase [Bacteroidia bacterium]